jgi:hypothetical protein
LAAFERRASLDQTKNPRLTGNRGFFGNSILDSLEIASHVAGGGRYAMPNGHQALTVLDAQVMFKRVHF